MAKDSIRKVEVLEYPELGMEAVWKSRRKLYFIVVDDKGNDFLSFNFAPSSSDACHVLGVEHYRRKVTQIEKLFLQGHDSHRDNARPRQPAVTVTCIMGLSEVIDLPRPRLCWYP